MPSDQPHTRSPARQTLSFDAFALVHLEEQCRRVQALYEQACRECPGPTFEGTHWRLLCEVRAHFAELVRSWLVKHHRLLPSALPEIGQPLDSQGTHATPPHRLIATLAHEERVLREACETALRGNLPPDVRQQIDLQRRAIDLQLRDLATRPEALVPAAI